jgi:serine/threonine protein kinase
MPTCPTCFSKFPDGARTCEADGAELVPDATFAHVDRDIAPGTTVGEYTIESKLGQGGFGAVYRAVHPLIGKHAAVKVLSREFSSNPQMVSRFIAEARAVNQIRHRNIIDIFSFGQLPDGRQYYIMELLEGTSFDAYLSRRKRLDFDEALPIFRGIARALDAAHAKGILHRDLKPENIFLVRHEDSFEPKLLDFGLVKLLDAKAKRDGDGGESHNTKTGTPMGTPYYMSPEQCRGQEVDARTDVYSFGTLVFEVLTGNVPFRGAATLDILFQHMSSPPPAASERCPAVPSALDAPLAQIMAKDPNGRPGSVGEAVEFLARAAGMPAESQRRIMVDSGTMTAAERAVAPTVMLAPSSPPQAPAQTFLGAETSIAPPKKSRAPLVAAVAALVAGAGIVIGISLYRAPAPAPAVEHAAPSENVPDHQKWVEVDLKIDGIPDGTRVTIDGSDRGTSGGPFRVHRNKPTDVELSASGYKPKKLTVTPGDNTVLAVAMDKEPEPAASAVPSAVPSASTVPAKPTLPTAAPKPQLHHDLEKF